MDVDDELEMETLHKATYMGLRLLRDMPEWEPGPHEFQVEVAAGFESLFVERLSGVARRDASMVPHPDGGWTVTVINP